ncbi:hypothetical protein H4R19_000194 [Coemansia spiralis]|nr:hypothetical protein H4R19_000194 [Coemansia spiralis]
MARRNAQQHVRSACTNCKQAHLACDHERPCQRCVRTGKCDSCKDVQPKKRGRPRTRGVNAPDRTIAGQPQMKAQMFQFALDIAPEIRPGPAAPTSAPSPGTHRQSPQCTTPAASRAIVSAEPTPDCVRHAAPRTRYTAGPGPAAFLFLSADLRCLRIDEPHGAPALLGHSLLGMVNRSAQDFVSEHDWPRVMQALDDARPLQRGGPVYPPIEPGAFQDLPLDRLLQPAHAGGGGGTTRAHLRIRSGSYSLFDICVYSGTTPALGQAYLVCCITPFDALDGLPAPPPAKRHCAAPPAVASGLDALYLLAAVTDSDAACADHAQSPHLPTPAHSTPSPSLVASTPRLGPLPPLSAMLKAIGADSPPAPL